MTAEQEIIKQTIFQYRKVAQDHFRLVDELKVKAQTFIECADILETKLHRMEEATKSEKHQ